MKLDAEVICQCGSVVAIDCPIGAAPNCVDAYHGVRCEHCVEVLYEDSAATVECSHELAGSVPCWDCVIGPFRTLATD